MKFKKTVRTIISLVYFLSCISLSAQKTYRVFPNGKGENAIEEVQEIIRKSGVLTQSDVKVLLADGIYFLGKPLVFNENDGGQGDYTITYKAMPGTTPVLSGGIKADKWEKVSGKLSLFRCKLDQVKGVRNIYVDGQRAKRAIAEKPITGLKIFEEQGEKVGIVFSKNDFLNDTNTSHVEINYSQAWRDFYFLVDSIEEYDEANYLVRIKNFNWAYTLGYNFISPGEGGGPMDKFYLVNAFELLDKPGEWYFDENTKYLYYCPLKEQNIHHLNIIVPVLEQLVQIESTSRDKKVRNLRFEGIYFKHSGCWDWPFNNGFMQLQASAVIASDIKKSRMNQRSGLIKLPGAIHIDGACNVHFFNNSFSNLGTSAINIDNDAENLSIERNTFNDISAAAISIGRWNHDRIDQEGEGVVNNTLVRNNRITKIGVEFRGLPGIEAFYTANLIIDHNELYDMPYSAISVGWGWSAIPTSSANIEVTNNKIIGTIRKCNDGGGIYSLSAFSGKGLLIEGNYINELLLPPSSNNEGIIYTDEKSSNVNIKNNVVEGHRKWFYYNVPLTVRVDSMYISGEINNYGGNKSKGTKVTVNAEHLWNADHPSAKKIISNAGILPIQLP